MLVGQNECMGRYRRLRNFFCELLNHSFAESENRCGGLTAVQTPDLVRLFADIERVGNQSRVIQ